MRPLLAKNMDTIFTTADGEKLEVCSNLEMNTEEQTIIFSVAADSGEEWKVTMKLEVDIR